MKVDIDERIVVNIPKTTQNLNSKAHKTWIRRAVMRSVYKVREDILKERNEDIFGLFVMTDCIEINIRGTLESLHVDPAERKKRIPKAKRGRRR